MPRFGLSHRRRGGRRRHNKAGNRRARCQAPRSSTLMAEGLDRWDDDLDFEWVPGVIVGNGDLHRFLSIPSRPASSRPSRGCGAVRRPRRRAPGRRPPPEGGWARRASDGPKSEAARARPAWCDVNHWRPGRAPVAPGTGSSTWVVRRRRGRGRCRPPANAAASVANGREPSSLATWRSSTEGKARPQRHR